MDKLLKDYAELQRTIKDMSERKTRLSKVIKAIMDEKGEEKHKTDFGTFTVLGRKYYTYSGKVKEIEADLRLAQADEIKSGKAKEKIIKTLTFRGNDKNKSL